MTVHFFTKGHKGAGSSRQRAFLVAEELKKRGTPANVYSPPRRKNEESEVKHKTKSLLFYVKAFYKIKSGDIIYLQRTIHNKYFTILVLLYKFIFQRKSIFDFDDALYLLPHHALQMKILTRFSNAVIVGSHALKDWAKQHNKKVYLIPTSINTSLYEKFSVFHRRENKKPVVGWIGNGVDHYENLKLLVPAFKKLAQKDIYFTFRLIGSLGSEKVYSLFKNIKNLDVEFIDELEWGKEGVIQRVIQQFNIGLMPLTDTEWNRGKSTGKAIEYMGCGVVPVASPVGENNYLIEEKKDGFFAISTEEWIDTIKILIQDTEMRARIGVQAQKKVQDNYSYKANIPRIICALRSV